MAIRKETIRRQANEMTAQALQPGESIRGGVYAIQGPSPYLMAVLNSGLLGFLIGQFIVTNYYIAVTEQRVIFVRMSGLSGRPKEIAFTEPLQNARVSDYRRNSVWSFFRYLLPNASKPVRLNVHRIWREDLDATLAAFGVPAA